MADRTTDTSNAQTPGRKAPNSPDELIKGDKSKTELTEDDLKKVSGGLKIDYKE